VCILAHIFLEGMTRGFLAPCSLLTKLVHEASGYYDGLFWILVGFFLNLEL